MVQNRESIKRIQEAAKYQKLAIHALFPESIDSHLTVIEQEMKAMGKNLLFDVVKGVMKEVMAQSMEESESTTDQGNHRNSEETADQSNSRNTAGQHNSRNTAGQHNSRNTENSRNSENGRTRKVTIE